VTAARQPILVIEADPDLGHDIAGQLLADNYPALRVSGAQHAALVAQQHPPRAVILGNFGSPHAPLALLRHIRRSGPHARWQPDVPVIMINASSHQADLLRAFDAGADDVLNRPPIYLELRARLQAILRRTTTRRTDNGVLRIGVLAIDTTSREVTINGRPVQLRRREYDLLAYLASDPKRVFHKQELLTNLWGYASPSSTRTLDSHASRLRRKLSSDGERWIINVHGVGYQLAPRRCER